MAFVLWIDDQLAWAQGRHECRAMGAAVIAVSDRFRQRDFRIDVICPPRDAPSYVGMFASLSEVNRYLAQINRTPQRRSQGKSRRAPTRKSLLFSTG